VSWRIPQRLYLPAATLAGALLALGIMFLYLSLDPQEGKYNDSDIKRLAAEQQSKATPTPPIEPQIYALVRPAVVLITQDINNATKGPGKGIGSGVVFDLNGSILTAYHVVAASDTVNVRFYDGTTATGTVTQKQPDRDLAVVQVSRLPDSVQPAVLGGGIDYGDQVLAIGAPFGLDGSVSSGIVSGLGRSFTVEETGQVLNNMIQFDAAVNPGNSGGPLIDMGGHVIGIVSGIVNPTGNSVFIGLGFAVPIEAAAGIVAPIT
jgi:S1-C subfamily serine protease